MRITPISNYPLQNINSNNSARKQNISFLGNIYLKGKVSDINKIPFPDDLYLNLNKVFENFKNEDKAFTRWEDFIFALTKLFTKRCNYLGLSKDKSSGIIGFDKNGAKIILKDNLKHKNAKTTEFNWSKEYKQLEEFFDSLFAFPYSERNFVKKFQEGLPEILKKQGWIK